MIQVLLKRLTLSCIVSAGVALFLLQTGCGGDDEKDKDKKDETKIDAAFCANLDLEYREAADGSGYCYEQVSTNPGVVTDCTGEEDGVLCDDSDACTFAEICANEVCVGVAVPGLDDDNPCTEDSCVADTGEISHEEAPMDGTTCDDGDLCTTTGICASGSCAGTPLAEIDDLNACTDDTCDSSTGEIAHDPVPMEGITCDDNDVCSANDICVAGICLGDYTVDVSGQPIDDNDACTSDFCDTDGNRQNVAYTADEAAALGLSGITIDDITNPCLQYVCQVGASDSPHMDVVTGSCADPAAGRTDGPCVMWICQTGICAANVVEQAIETAPITGGDTLHPECRTRACDTTTGQVVYVEAYETEICNDGNECTLQDVCAAGSCVGSEDFAEGHSCDDGDICTVGDHCDDGICVFNDNLLARALDPNDAYDPAGIKGTASCLGYVCDIHLGVIADGTPMNNTACDDGNDCSDNDRCFDGECIGNNEATDDQQCDIEVDETDCLVGVCNKGVCLVASDSYRPQGTVCLGVNECKNYQCDGAGVCQENSDVVDDTPCGIGISECQEQTCQTGTCTTTNISDGTVCTLLTDPNSLLTRHTDCVNLKCDGIGSCIVNTANHEPDTTLCDDGNLCNGADHCDANGYCVEINTTTRANQDAGYDNEDWADGTPTICDDVNPCTRLTFCDDGNGFCQSGLPLVAIDDSNSCTVDACDDLTGTVTHDPVTNGTPCDDGNLCTMRDICLEGQCHGNEAPDGFACNDPNIEIDPNRPLDCQAEICVAGICSINTSFQENAPCDDDEMTCTKTGFCDQGGNCIQNDASAGYGENCMPSTRDATYINNKTAATGIRFVDAPCWVWECDEIGGCSVAIEEVPDPGNPGGGVACDLDSDGDPCDDVCIGGVCTNIVTYVNGGGSDNSIIDVFNLSACDTADGEPCDEVCWEGLCTDVTSDDSSGNAIANNTLDNIACTDNNICTGNDLAPDQYADGTPVYDMDMCVDAVCRGTNMTQAGQAQTWACNVVDGSECDQLCDDSGSATNTPTCISGNVPLSAYDPRDATVGITCDDNFQCTTGDVCGGGVESTDGVCSGTNLTAGWVCPLAPDDCQQSCQEDQAGEPYLCMATDANNVSYNECEDNNPCTSITWCDGSGACADVRLEANEGSTCTFLASMDLDPNPCDEYCLDHDGDTSTPRNCTSINTHGLGDDNALLAGGMELDDLNGQGQADCESRFRDMNDPCSSYACHRGRCVAWDSTLTGFGAHPYENDVCGTGTTNNPCVTYAYCDGENRCVSYNNVEEMSACSEPQCMSNGDYYSKTCLGGVCADEDQLIGSCAQGIATCMANDCYLNNTGQLCHYDCEESSFDLVNIFEDISGMAGVGFNAWADDLVSPIDFGTTQVGSTAFDETCVASPINEAEAAACDDGSVLIRIADALDFVGLSSNYPNLQSESENEGFWFYNRRYTHMSISVNGTIILHNNNVQDPDTGDTLIRTKFVYPFVGPEQDIPTLPIAHDGSNAAQILPFQDDLTMVNDDRDTRLAGSDIYTYHAGGPTDSPWDDYLIIQWDELAFYGCADANRAHMTFQVKWWFWTGQVAFVYPEGYNSDGSSGLNTCILGRVNGEDAVIGLKDEDDDGDNNGDPQHLIGENGRLIEYDSGIGTEALDDYYVFWPMDTPITQYGWRGWQPFDDISSSGDRLFEASTCDTCCDLVKLDYPVFYDGQPRWHMYVCADGYIHFLDPTIDDTVFNQDSVGPTDLVDSTPSVIDETRLHVAPFWLDDGLRPEGSQASNVYMQWKQSAGDEQLIVQWHHVEYDFDAVGVESGEGLCSDNLDNEPDGDVDCDDNECTCALACGGSGCGVSFQVVFSNRLGMVEFRYLNNALTYDLAAVSDLVSNSAIGLSYHDLTSSSGHLPVVDDGYYGVDLTNNMTPAEHNSSAPWRENDADVDEYYPRQQLNLVLMQNGKLLKY